MTPFEDLLSTQLNLIHLGAYSSLEEIDKLPRYIGAQVLRVLIQKACKSQHIGNIRIARQSIARIPPDWLVENFDCVVKQAIDFGDEWEYCRLLELVDEHLSSLLSKYVSCGLCSSVAEIQKIAEDFSSG